MDNTILVAMGELVQSMDDAQLDVLGVQFKGNAGVEDLISKIKTARKTAKEEEEIKIQFENSVKSLLEVKEMYSSKAKDSKAILVGLPKPPANILNVHFSWSEVEEDDVTKPQSEVEIVDVQAQIDKDGKILEQAKTHKEMRYPKVKAWRWLLEVNKVLVVNPRTSSGCSGNEEKTLKRAISIFKKVGLSLTYAGSFSSGQKACDHFKLVVGKDSSNRVLLNNGLYSEQYKPEHGTIII